MKTQFTVGKRFGFVRTLAVLVNAFIVFGFYFIYRYLFEEMAPTFVNLPMALIFLAVGFAVVKFTFSLADRYATATGYIVSEDCLIFGLGKRQIRYYWKDFTGADLNSVGTYKFGTVLPIRFHMGEKVLELNQYIGDIYLLASMILDRITPYATFDPELKDQIKSMEGIL